MSEILLDDANKIAKEFKDMDDVDNFISNVDNSVVLDVLNLVKTSSVLGFNFDDCKKEVKARYPVADKLIGAIVLKHLNAAGHDLDFSGGAESELNINSWDEYYYNICKQVSRNAKCFSRQIGTVLVRDKTIIGTGYNGPPRGVPPCDKRWEVDDELVNCFIDRIGREPKEKDWKGKCPRQVLGYTSGQGLEWCVAGHAERNSLIQAAREGICTKHSTLYMTCGIPCSPCLVEIINAGVEEIVVSKMEVYDISAQYLLDNSDLKVRVFSFL
jgi:dCMP deaminase